MKIVALGINTLTNKCCLIKSKATFEQLEQDFELYAKEYSANDWGGKCEVEYALNYNNLEFTDRQFKISGKYCGSDYDWGREDQFTFKFDKIVKVKAKE